MEVISYFPVSSNIQFVSWSADTALWIRFIKGSEYKVKEGVSKSLMLEWIAAESAGKFFNEKVKPNFTVEKVQDES